MLNRIKEALKLNEAQWVGFKVGAIAGLIFFIIYGAPAALVYGGYGAVLLAGRIFGTPVEPVILARTAIAVGMVLGLFSTALLFVVLGSLFGAGIGSVGNLISARVKAIREAAETAAQSAIPVSEPLAGPSAIENARVRSWTKAGAVVGAALFFVFGLIPGALYGGSTGILLASRVFSVGAPSEHAVKALYVIGAVMGALGTITVFLVIGAVGGTLLGYAYNSGKEKLAASTDVGGDLDEVRAKSK